MDNGRACNVCLSFRDLLVIIQGLVKSNRLPIFLFAPHSQLSGNKFVRDSNQCKKR